MSRRSHHPIRRHVRPRHAEAKRPGPTTDRPDSSVDGDLEVGPLPGTEALLAAPVETSPPDVAVADGGEDLDGAPHAGSAVELAIEPAADAEPVLVDGASAVEDPASEPGPGAAALAAIEILPPVAEPPALPVPPSVPPPGPPGAATAPQLRRFIKSRSYIPMHELRRRFGIVIEDDDVAAVHVGGHTVYVGLPPREGELLGELLRAGDIGYEASFDPVAPVIVGVFPIRPVTRS